MLRELAAAAGASGRAAGHPERDLRPAPADARPLARRPGRSTTSSTSAAARRACASSRTCVASGKKPILELAGNDGIVVWRTPTWPTRPRRSPRASSARARSAWCRTTSWCTPRSPTGCRRACCEQVTEAIRPGFPDDEDVLLSPVRRSERFFALLRQALDNGAQLLTGGHRIEVDGTVSDTGVFLQPTVVRVDGLERARRLRHGARGDLLPAAPDHRAGAGPATRRCWSRSRLRQQQRVRPAQLAVVRLRRGHRHLRAPGASTADC